MTAIRIFRRGDTIVGIQAEGHSGYAQHGEDIVCAAITAAMRLVEATLNDAMSLGAAAKIDDATARITIMCKNPAASPVFEGFSIVMRQFEQEYSQYIEISEVQQNA